jgi:hypothetical protein
MVPLLPSSMAALHRIAASLTGGSAWRTAAAGAAPRGARPVHGSGAPAAPPPAAADATTAGGDRAAPSSSSEQRQRQRGDAARPHGGGGGGGGAPDDQPPEPAALSAVEASEDGGARLCSPRASGDLPAAAARAASLRLLQRHFNVSAPGLRGQAVLARVVRANAGAVALDPGYYGLSALAVRDLGAPQAYTPAGEPLRERDEGAAHALARGRHVKVRLGRLFTPYGDVELEPTRMRPDVRRKLVWDYLVRCKNGGRPVAGRVLNPCPGGYAVGVAGYVALLPSKHASIDNIRAIGRLQEFHIHHMSSRGRGRVIELSNIPRAGGGGGGRGRFGGVDDDDDDGAPAGLGGGAPAATWSNL